MRFAASPRCVPPAACPQRRSRPAPAAQCVPLALALPPALTRCARRRLPARCAAAGGGGDAKKGSWPSADELRRASSGAPDAAKHFDVTGVVVAPSFRASRSFLGASTIARRPGLAQLLRSAHALRAYRAPHPLRARPLRRPTPRADAVARAQRRRTRRRRAARTPAPCACCCCRRATSAAPCWRRPCWRSACRSAAWAPSCASSQKARATPCARPARCTRSHFLLTGTRDYNAGEAPEPATAAVAQALGLALRPDFAARHSDVAVRLLRWPALAVLCLSHGAPPAG